jgi:hypothetical protein
MVENDTSLTTLLMTNTFMPTGGWIRPSSTVITMMTPNQIGSKPRWVITGKDDRHGQDDHRHRVHQAAEHQIHHHDQREHAVGPRPRPVRNSVTFCGVCVTVRK